MPNDIETRAAAQSRSRSLDDLIELLPEVVLVVGQSDGRVVGANAPALCLYGYQRDELLSMDVGQLVAAWTGEAIAGQLATPERFESLHRRRDGTSFPVEVSAQ